MNVVARDSDDQDKITYTIPADASLSRRSDLRALTMAQAADLVTSPPESQGLSEQEASTIEKY